MLRVQKIIISISLLTLSGVAHAAEKRDLAFKNVPCAVVEGFKGKVQVFTPHDQVLNRVDRKVDVPCGGWILVSDGWAVLKHRQGFELKLGAQTFIEIYDHTADHQYTGTEHVVLYRGKIFANVRQGSGELRAVTANARARLKMGSGILFYDEKETKTQLISVDQKITLENRFQEDSRVALKPGESTTISFKARRVVPSTPRAVKAVLLKIWVNDIPLSEDELKLAVFSASDRQSRKFAEVSSPSGTKRRILRSLAFKSREESKEFVYDRYPGSSDLQKQDSKARQEWLQNLAGDHRPSQSLFFPERKVDRKVSGTHIQEQKMEMRYQSKKKQMLDQERKRLLQELSELNQFEEVQPVRITP